VYHSWSHTRRFISAIDAGSRTITTEGGRVLRPWNLWKDLAWGSKGYFHVENFLSNPLVLVGMDPGLELVEEDGRTVIQFDGFPGLDNASTRLVTTGLLGRARIPELPFENPDGSALAVDTDYRGKPRRREQRSAPCADPEDHRQDDCPPTHALPLALKTPLANYGPVGKQVVQRGRPRTSVA
jgi:hypothetical protein